MLQRVLIILAFVLLGFPAAAFENELIGKRDSEIQGYESNAGAVLIDEKGALTEFAMEYGKYKNELVLLLQKDTGKRRPDGDVPIYEIVQVIRAPKPEGFEMNTVGCFTKPNTQANDGDYVFAYVAYKDDGSARAIKGAWSFDWNAKKLAPVANNKIDCREIGD